MVSNLYSEAKVTKFVKNSKEVVSFLSFDTIKKIITQLNSTGNSKVRPMFQFKQFSISQDRCAMKVGTDGVLLGAWAELPDSGRILDIGTGTGLLVLMAAQRTKRAEITGVEIDAAAANQARENVQNSPWAERCHIVTADVRDYKPDVRYSTILSNPPYYNGSLLPPDAQRAQARHASSLPPNTLAECARRLLEPSTGTLQVVLPLSEEEALLTACAPYGLFPLRRTLVVTRRPKPPRRVLLQLSFQNGRATEGELLVSEADGTPTEMYKKLTRDFYL